MKFRSFLLSIAAFAVATAAHATPLQEEIILRNGERRRGEVTASDDGALTLRFVQAGQDATMTLRRDQVVPRSWYDVRSRAQPDTVESHLELDESRAAEVEPRLAALAPATRRIDSARRKYVAALKEGNLGRSQNGFAASVRVHEQALGLDSRSSDARAFRARVEIASAESRWRFADRSAAASLR
jgi:hypothetical protein